MRILSFKPGHDGAVALVEDGELVFSLESEKDSFPRYSDVTPAVLLDAFERLPAAPDVICLSGWVKGFHSSEPPVGAGYLGWSEADVVVGRRRFLGKDTAFFSSSHERSHLMSAYGMSDFDDADFAYGLVWEGNIGSFYEYGPGSAVRLVGQVLDDPGNKYQFPFALADPSTPQANGGFRFSNAGKMMALAAYGRSSAATPEESELIDLVLGRRRILLELDKDQLSSSPFHDIGVESGQFKDLAARHSDRIFEIFHDFAQRELTEGYPLIISGGCGLNCGWNTRWRDCDLFADVFVPPVPNDAGSAIGTAIDAQRHFGGSSKIRWSVYAGAEFVHELASVTDDFVMVSCDMDDVAADLAQGAVIAWAQGRGEIGPRALGNRSIVASPLRADMHGRLNMIKQREGYRPIAPICLEEDVAQYFDWEGPTPYMLHFQRVRDPALLPAVTHVDGTARVQTITPEVNPAMAQLLRSFGTISGVPVLCNTSLNFSGRGFIDRTSDLVRFVRERDLDGMVVDGTFYRRMNRLAPGGGR